MKKLKEIKEKLEDLLVKLSNNTSYQTNFRYGQMTILLWILGFDLKKAELLDINNIQRILRLKKTLKDNEKINKELFYLKEMKREI